MAHTLRIRKSGSRVYEIRIFRGFDSETGKRLAPCSMTWPVPEEMSAREAEQKIIEIEEEFRLVVSGAVLKEKPVSETVTFRKYTERYLRGIRPSHAASTVTKYQNVFRRAEKTLGDIPLADITKESIKDYLTDIEENYSHGTLCVHFKILNLLFHAAWEEELIHESPMLHLKLPRRPKDKVSREEKSYSKQEVSRILKLLEKEPVMFRTLVYFLLDTGCRRGEAAGLRWENVDLKTGKTRICSNLQYLSGHGKYLTTPKSGQVRTVILSRQVLKIMQEWKKAQEDRCRAAGLPPFAYVFTNKTGELMYPDAISRMFRNFGRKNGIRHFHPHALRHTMATLSILNGADVVSISKKLGHSSPAVTLNVYSHANEEALKKAGEILAGVIYR